MKSYLLLLISLTASAQVVTPPSSTVFDKDAVHEIRLTFQQADWFEQLTDIYAKYPDNTPYIEASLEWGQNKFDTVGVRFKGNSSYNGATTKKKPFRIKLNEFTKGQKIDGMSSFGLSNAWNDPSFVREKPYYEMAAASGLAAPRSNFAALYINGEYWGLYVLGEIVNGDFLKNHFAKNDDTGNLYKASDPGANLAYLGEDPTSYQSFFSKESNEDVNDWTDLIELARIFDQTAAADLPGKLDSLIDVDSFLTALALDNMTVNLDSYVGMSQNYYLYRRPSDKKWVWIPWDPSLAFGALSQGLSVQQMKDLALEWTQSTNTGVGGQGGGFGGGSATRPVATKLWAVPKYKARYREIYRSLVEKQMVPAVVVARMNALRTLIWSSVEKDTQKLVTMAEFEAAMTSDGGGSTQGGGTAPGGPGGGGGAAPGGGGAGPGAPAGGGGLGGAPGLQPFIEGRVTSVKALLDGQTPLTISATPASLFLAQTAGSTTAAAQTVALSLSDAKTGTYTATTSASWLTVGTASGTIPASLRISASAAGMSAGTYTGAVNIAVSGASNTPLSIPVTMSVAAAPSVVTSPASLTLTSFGAGGPQGGGAGAIIQAVAVASTAGASSFTAAVSGSTCGNFLTVSPTSGTTPATLTVTATAPATGGNCTARIDVTSSGLTAAAVPVTLTVQTGPAGGFGPAITSIVNSASYVAGPAAPGTILTIFGANIGPRDLVTGLATTLGGVGVTFDGVAAPILYARANQVGLVVPFEASGKAQSALQLTVNGQQAPVIQQAISPATPGIFTTASTGTGQASVINQTGAVNGPNAMAAKGSTVAIYLTGAGVLRPAGKTGALGTLDLAIAGTVAVTIGGQTATVQYSGAVPGSVQGVYQINAVVPSGSATGSVPVAVTIGGVASQSNVTMYVQ
jgi:uncharacterized protein (TIGR03437 family)